MNELLGFDTSVAWPVALRVGPFALATSVVGLRSLPRAWDTYFAVLVALSFLLMGGPAEVAAALVAPAPPRLPDVAAAGLVRGVMAGLAIAAPMLVGRLGVEVLFATTARAPLGTTYVVGRKLALWAIVALVARRLVFRAL